MKKPTKEPIAVKEDCGLIDTYVQYTPADLRNIADAMEETGILWIQIDSGDDWIVTEQARMESPQQAEVRYKRELRKWEKWKEAEKVRKEKAKEKLIREAKKLGMVLKDG